MPPPAEATSSTFTEPQPELWAPDQTRGREQDSAPQEASEAGLFFGKCFLLVGFDTEAEAQLSVLVTENGGRVLTGRTRIVADYAVVPLLGCSVEATVDEVVTDTWLVKSLSLLLPFFLISLPSVVDRGCSSSFSGHVCGEGVCSPAVL